MEITRTADQAGLFGTIAFHALLLLLLILFGKSCNVEVIDPMDGGVAVSLGDPNAGGPDVSSSMQEITSSSEAEEEESSQVTSDNSDAPAVKKTPTSSTTNKPTSQTTPKTTEPEPKKTADPRSQYGGKSDNGGTSSGTGEDPGTGGKPDGSDGVPDGTGPGSGKGFAGDGFEGKIDGFKAIGTYKPVNKQQEFGKVVVKVCVDKAGKVLSAQGGQRGTTNTSAYLKRISEEAARKFKFERIGTASEVNCGFITFTYKAS